MKTFEERKEDVLRTMDPDLICEVLQIEAEELLDRFEDRLMLFFEREDDED